MALESVLRTKLLTFSAVTAYTGTGATALIRPDQLAQGDSIGATGAAVIIEVDAERNLNTLEGTGGRRYCDVTMRCRARQKATARALAEAIRVNGTDPGTGLAGASWTNDGTVYDAVLEDTNTSYTPDDDGSGRGWYDVFCNYVVSFSEVV